MSLRGIKLITFDATNTLLKFRVPPWQHYVAVARDFDFKGTETEIKNRLLDTYKKMWNKYPNFGKDKINWVNWWQEVVKLTFNGQLPNPADVEIIGNRLIEEFKTSKCWCLAEGGDKLINLIRNSGISLGVISNFDPRLNDILHNISLDKYFDFIVTSYESGISKPDEKIFEYAIKTSGKKINSSECLHIGDDINKDYKGARGAGWHALLVNNNVKLGELPVPEHAFKNLNELNTAIEQNKLRLNT